MAITFCPLCKSMMKDGICTNRKCGNSQLEIDFVKFVDNIKTFPKSKINYLNNSFIIGHGFKHASSSLLFDSEKECISTDISENIGYMVKNKAPINMRMCRFFTNVDELWVDGIRFYTIYETKNRKRPFKVFKYYLEYYIVSSPATTKNGDFILGSNDLSKWYIASDREYIDESLIRCIEISVGFNKYVCDNWVIALKDNETGIKIKTVFQKEFAYNLFKDRELKEGKKRRTALKHIVDDYKRHKPNDIIVNEHFRGDRVFEWRGITFTLTPPVVAAKRIEEKKAR